MPESIIRVLYVDSSVGLGGGQTNLIEILRTLDRDRVIPLVGVPSESRLARWCSNEGIEIIPLPFRTAPLHPISDALGSLYGIALLAREMRARQIDVVHGNTFKAGLVASVAARLAGVPFVYYEQAQITHPPLDGLLARLSRRIITVSAAVAAKHLPRFRGKISVIPTGVDTDRFAPDEVSIPTGAITFLGRITEEKGLDTLVEAAPLVVRGFPEARFIICGSPFTKDDRAYEAHVKSRIDELGLTSVFEFTGFVRDVRQVLSRSDALVLPSRRDALPKVVMEAMALAKPVVAAHVGGLPELIADGENGLLVPPENAGDLASALLELLRHPDLARSMGQKGRRIVEERYRAEAATARVVGVYREVTGRS